MRLNKVRLERHEEYNLRVKKHLGVILQNDAHGRYIQRDRKRVNGL